MSSFTLTRQHENQVSRRDALKRAACGFGHTAMLGLLGNEALAAASSEKSAGLTARQGHFQATAKRVIFLFIHGGVSHIDSFDPQPELTKHHGKPSPITKPEFEFATTGNLLKSPWSFRPYGECGMPVSELFPEIGSIVDDIALIRTMQGNQVAHGGASLMLHTGEGVTIRPSLGAWTLYGLGSENDNLPGFVTLSPSTYHGGAQNYGSAFLPATYQGTAIGDGNSAPRSKTIRNLTPANPNTALQRLQLDLLKKANSEHTKNREHDERLQSRIESFELAFRMQMTAPDVLDITQETGSTKAQYGIGSPTTDDFGYQCLLARRLSESGVRFVQVNHSYPRNYWDAHGNLMGNHGTAAPKIDKPIAGLIKDLKQRGLLDETLVVWGTEFGRTPASQGSDGRDHHPHAFSMWMAGGGIKGGTIYGKTDDFGYYPIEDPCPMKDFHATILHTLGLDHERLTYRYSGRDYRLTDVEGKVVREVLSSAS